MEIVGQIGFGLVWGWFTGNYYRAWQKRPYRLTLSFLALTALICGLIVWMVSGTAVIPFLIATFLSLSLHVGWQNKLTPTDSA